MNNFFYLLLSITLLFGCQQNKKQNTTDEHSAEYALDYEGVYKGTYPCADCSGIETSLSLNKDKTFVYKEVYLGKEDGRFSYKGNYTVKENILTIEDDGKPTHFLLGESSLTLLGDDLKPKEGELAAYYLLKKQKSFDYAGTYETFSEEKGAYWQKLSINPKGENYEVQFSASKIKGRYACSFSGAANLKNDTLWVNISNKKEEEVLMYIAPSHDNLGVEVFTKDFEKRFAMMSYCGGGASLAGKYIKNSITANSIGVFNSETTIAEMLQTLPNVQVRKTVGHGEFADDVYDDYEVYTNDNKHLFTLTPKDTANVHQKINRVLVSSPFFKTEKGIGKNATYQDIKNAYTIIRIEPTEEDIVLIVDEINADFSISKKKLKEGWWNDKTKTVNPDKIPSDASINYFILWWNK